MIYTADFYLLNFEQAQTFVLGNDLSSLVAVLVNREAIGIKPKLFGYLKWVESCWKFKSSWYILYFYYD